MRNIWIILATVEAVALIALTLIPGRRTRLHNNPTPWYWIWAFSGVSAALFAIAMATDVKWWGLPYALFMFLFFRAAVGANRARTVLLAQTIPPQPAWDETVARLVASEPKVVNYDHYFVDPATKSLLHYKPGAREACFVARLSTAQFPDTTISELINSADDHTCVLADDASLRSVA